MADAGSGPRPLATVGALALAVAVLRVAPAVAQRTAG